MLGADVEVCWNRLVCREVQLASWKRRFLHPSRKRKARKLPQTCLPRLHTSDLTGHAPHAGVKLEVHTRSSWDRRKIVRFGGAAIQNVQFFSGRNPPGAFSRRNVCGVHVRLLPAGLWTLRHLLRTVSESASRVCFNVRSVCILVSVEYHRCCASTVPVRYASFHP